MRSRTDIEIDLMESDEPWMIKRIEVEVQLDIRDLLEQVINKIDVMISPQRIDAFKRYHHYEIRDSEVDDE